MACRGRSNEVPKALPLGWYKSGRWPAAQACPQRGTATDQGKNEVTSKMNVIRALQHIGAKARDSANFIQCGSPKPPHFMARRVYGVRRRSKAATALWLRRAPNSIRPPHPKRCRAALATALHNVLCFIVFGGSPTPGPSTSPSGALPIAVAAQGSRTGSEVGLPEEPG